jgi:hypothetical protein
MSDERSLDVYEIRLQPLELRPQRTERAELHRSILRVARHSARWHPEDVRLGIARSAGIFGRNQERFMAGGMQSAAESLDGSGNAVDPRKVDVRDHQDAHASSGSR